MVGKAGGYIGKTAQIPIFASKEGKLCDIAKIFYHFLGHTITQIQEKDDLFQGGKLIVENEKYCLIHILPINIVKNSLSAVDMSKLVNKKEIGLMEENLGGVSTEVSIC